MRWEEMSKQPPLPKLVNATKYQQEQVELYAKAYGAACRAEALEEKT